MSNTTPFVTLMGLAALTCLTACDVPPLIEPDHPATAHLYREAVEEWWQWLLEIPTPDNPINDSTGAQCAVNQADGMWFLVGTNGGVVERECTIPRDTALFFPLLNAFATNGAGEDYTEEELLAMLDPLLDAGCELYVELDGAPLLDDPSSLRTTSEGFAYEVPADNLLGQPEGLRPLGVADGYWALLAPLEPGQHTLKFGGSLCDEQGQPFFHTGAAYQLTVE